jgi:dihydroneopterin aldolase
MSIQSADRLHVQGLELECIVGVRPPERKRPQRVRLDVTLGLNLAPAGRSGRIAHTVDYARVADEIQILLRFREYRLIEMATEELGAMLFAAHPALDAVEIRLEKPEALRGRAAAGAVSVTRERASYPPLRRALVGGHAELFLETAEATLESIQLEPGARFAPPPGRRVTWLTQGALSGQTEQVRVGEVLRVEAPFEAGAEGATLFACHALASV